MKRVKTISQNVPVAVATVVAVTIAAAGATIVGAVATVAVVVNERVGIP
jgi:hypothetical protein